MFPLIPLPIIEAIITLDTISPTDLTFPLIPLPIIEAI